MIPFQVQFDKFFYWKLKKISILSMNDVQRGCSIRQNKKFSKLHSDMFLQLSTEAYIDRDVTEYLPNLALTLGLSYRCQVLYVTKKS